MQDRVYGIPCITINTHTHTLITVWFYFAKKQKNKTNKQKKTKTVQDTIVVAPLSLQMCMHNVTPNRATVVKEKPLRKIMAALERSNMNPL